jgi:hypothetical protein
MSLALDESGRHTVNPAQYHATPAKDPEPEPKTDPKADDSGKTTYPADKVVDKTINGQTYKVIEHTVRPGENVWTIVHENGTKMTMEEFYALNPKFNPNKQNGELEHPNPGDDPDFIVPGQKLHLTVDGAGSNTLDKLSKSESAQKTVDGYAGQPFAYKPDPDGYSPGGEAKKLADDAWTQTQQAADYELRLAYQQGGKAELDRRLAGMQQYAPDNQKFNDYLNEAAGKIAKENPTQSGPAVTKYEDGENVKQFTTELQSRWDPLTPAQKQEPNAFANLYKGLVTELDADKNGQVDDASQSRGLKTAALKFELDLKKDLKPEEKKKLIEQYLGNDPATWQLAAADGTIKSAMGEMLKVGDPQETLQKMKGLLTPEQMADFKAPPVEEPAPTEEAAPPEDDHKYDWPTD